MADRVHPGEDSAPVTGESATTTSSSKSPIMPTHPMPETPVPPPPGTYVVQVPKDQIYRYPAPENARRYQNYSSPKPRRSCCCRCICWTLGLVVLLLVLLAVAAGVLYLVFRPEAPKYSVDDIAVRGLNLTSAGPISPEIDVTVRAQNPNDKIGIYYATDSSINVYFSSVNLCTGALPTFYQPSNNVTAFQTALKGSNVVLASAVRSSLVSEQMRRNVPLRLNLKAPVKIKVGSVKTWTITVKVKCDVTVDSLTADSRIVSRDCDYSVKLW